MKIKIQPFWFSIAAIFAAGLLFTEFADNEFYFFTSYVVLQAVIMATAWNILGGFTGYVNFGSAGFLVLVSIRPSRCTRRSFCPCRC